MSAAKDDGVNDMAIEPGTSLPPDPALVADAPPPYYPPTQPASRRGFGGTLLLVLIAFALGIAGTVYAAREWQSVSAWLAPQAPVQPQAVAAAPSLPQADLLAEAQVDRRVGEIEARLGRIDARASAAIGNADKAEALLTAFAARRAIDRGIQLGYLEGLLRERFGRAHPQAVAAILAAGQQPVTIEELRTGLDDLAPALSGSAPGESWWDGFRRELAGLVVLRKVNAPSPAPADRMARARRALEGGQVTTALAEVARMPGQARAEGWIASARRYAAAHDALDRIETAALLAPGGAPLRDAAPAPVAPEAPLPEATLPEMVPPETAPPADR